MNITEDGSAPRGTDYDGVLVMVGVTNPSASAKNLGVVFEYLRL